jgi:general secretion pathway protein A
MYEEFFGFTERPFERVRDPRYLFRSLSHTRAVEQLQDALARREGFVVVTGEPGVGKTTLCQALVHHLDRKIARALILDPRVSEDELLRLVLRDFAGAAPDASQPGVVAALGRRALIDRLSAFLNGLQRKHSSAVLVIDEAHHLPIAALDAIRLLSNLDGPDGKKLLQVCLVGEPKLGTILRTPALRPLDRRIAVRIDLESLRREEILPYVTHRLAIAGRATAVSLSPQALHLLSWHSGGLPHLVNVICDGALASACAMQTTRITGDAVARTAASLGIRRPAPSPLATAVRKTALWFASAGAASLLLATATGFVPRMSLTRTEPAPRMAEAPPALRSAPAAALDPLATPPAVAAVAPERAEPSVAPDTTPPETAASEPSAEPRYGVAVASFSLGDVAAPARVAALMAAITDLGYSVYHADVDLGPRGRWTRVIVGAFAAEADARRQQARLRSTTRFRDARLIKY